MPRRLHAAHPGERLVAVRHCIWTSRCCKDEPSFSGDNPVKYWNENELANPAPFEMAKVNAALAD